MEIDGVALEGLVAQHLRAWIEYGEGGARLYYWRTRSGVEVDFVVYGDSVFQAVEVRNSAQVRPTDVRALRAVQDDPARLTASATEDGTPVSGNEEAPPERVRPFRARFRPLGRRWARRRSRGTLE